MQSVTYDDVSFLLDHASVWCEGYEQYWYQKAWSVLEKQGATTYRTQKELYKVMLYAFALVHVYDEFCNYAFEESSETFFQDYLDDRVSPVIIGQMLVEHLEDGEIVEADDEALRIILNDLRYEVFHAICAEMSPIDVFYWMLFTGLSSSTSAFPLDDEAEEESFSEISSYEEYSRFVENEINMQGEEVTGDQLAAFDFICQLME